MAFELFTGKAIGRGAHRKVSDEEVAEIRHLSTVRTQAEIARVFGLHPSTVSCIVRHLKRTGKPPKCTRRNKKVTP